MLHIDDTWFYGGLILEVVVHFSYLADGGLRALFSIQGIVSELIDPKPELLCMF